MPEPAHAQEAPSHDAPPSQSLLEDLSDRLKGIVSPSAGGAGASGPPATCAAEKAMGDQEAVRPEEVKLKEPASPLANSPAEKPAEGVDHESDIDKELMPLISEFEKLAERDRSAERDRVKSCTVVITKPLGRAERDHSAKHDRVKSYTVVITNPLKDHKSLKPNVAREFGDVTILNSTKRNFLRAACLAATGTGFGMGFVFLLLVQGLAKAGVADASPPPPSPPLLPSTVICPNMPSSPLPLHVTEVFAPTFFNATCFADGATGDPCDVHDANAYVLQRSNMCILRSNY